jgi:hypothetical protein
MSRKKSQKVEAPAPRLRGDLTGAALRRGTTDTRNLYRHRRGRPKSPAQFDDPNASAAATEMCSEFARFYDMITVP